jgi:hypothetical protein
MAISLVSGQTASGASGNNTSHDQAFPGTLAEGSLVVAMCGTAIDSFTVTAITIRNAGNTADVLTLTRLRRQGTTVPCEVWWGIVPSGAGTTLRYTNASNTVKHVNQMEFTASSTVAGINDDAATGAADGSEGTADQATATAGDSGDGEATTVADAVLIGLLQCNGNHGSSPPGSNLGGVAATLVINTTRSAMSYRVVAATGTYDATFSWVTTQPWTTLYGAFEGAAVAGYNPHTWIPILGPLIAQ